MWRYSRIDQLDLDRFRPAGTAVAGATRAAARRPAIHALVDSLGPRAGWWSPSTGCWPPWPRRSARTCCRSAGPSDRDDGATLLGSVLGDPKDFPLLNDAFAATPW